MTKSQGRRPKEARRLNLRFWWAVSRLAVQGQSKRIKVNQTESDPLSRLAMRRGRSEVYSGERFAGLRENVGWEK
jgi:hypothetical protein